MSSKRTEFGRSLVETLAVLVVIAILLLAGLAGYNFTIHKYKKDQTVKAISELAVRYKLHPISTTGAVNIKSIYPEAERADAVNMKTADIETGRVRLEVSEDNSYFAVVVNSILDDSCRDYLEKGEYDAALLLKGDKYNSKSDTEYLALGKDFLKDFDLSKLTEEQQGKLSEVGLSIHSNKEAVINVICAGAPQAKTAALVFGDKCPKRGASHYYNGKCWPCPKDEKEDRYGVCCSAGEMNSCGICNDKASNCKVGGCPGAGKTVCDEDDTHQCVECVTDDNCGCRENNKRCFNKKCVECTKDDDCGNDANGCPTHCNLKTHMCSNACDLNTGLWRLSGDICVCNKTLQEGDACSTTCGVDCCPPKSPCKSGRCCPTDLPEYNELCVAGCGCDSDAHLVCNSGNRCVCDESNDYYWDGSQCKKGCRFNTLYHVNDLIGTCGICQENGNIAVKPGVDSNCCDSATWELKPINTPVAGCGICNNVGNVQRKDLNVCQQCSDAPNWVLGWINSDLQNVVTHSGTDTCCANDGTQGSECASDSCCSDTAPSCVSKGADGKGHCCQLGQVWNGTTCETPCVDLGVDGYRILHNVWDDGYNLSCSGTIVDEANDRTYWDHTCAGKVSGCYWGYTCTNQKLGCCYDYDGSGKQILHNVWDAGYALSCEGRVIQEDDYGAYSGNGAYWGYTCSGEIRGCCPNNLVTNGHCCPANTTWNGQGCVSSLPKCTFNGQTYDAGSAVGDCGTCVVFGTRQFLSASIIQDDSAKVPACHTCNTTTWQLDPFTDANTKTDDGKCCVNGELKFDEQLCPKNCTTDADCEVCQTCCGDTSDKIRFHHCVYGGTKNGERHGNQVCLNYRVSKNGKIVADFGGLQDCWSCPQITGTWNRRCTNLVTGETFDTGLAISTAIVGGCLLDPRKTWN